ncbi:MAG: hypothetical protein FWF43_07215, partial [Propionibacteriaceae bacterium]|nr:hypothetical protein [Propionibacteriaceae bacterium]
TPQEMSWLNDPDPSFVVTPWEPALNRPPVLEAGWFRGPVATDASAVGRMIPQPTVCDALGHIALVDDLLGDGFVLLGANVNPASTLTPEQKQGWDAMKAKYIAIRPQNAYSEDISDIIDLDGKILAWMERYGVKVIAVRPDKFVAAADVSGIGVPEL